MPNTMDPQTVAKMAHLSRLSSNPSPEFLKKYGDELSSILDYVAELQQVDTTGAPDLFGSARVVSLDDLAEDEPEPDEVLYQRIRQKIIDNFPNRQGDLLLLPGIFDN